MAIHQDAGPQVPRKVMAGRDNLVELRVGVVEIGIISESISVNPYGDSCAIKPAKLRR